MPGLRAESCRSCSSFCSNPPEDWPESGRDLGPRLTFRTGSERFSRFWTSLSTVRDREAPGSNPGPPTIPLNSNFAYRASTSPELEGLTVFGRARLISIAPPKGRAT